MIPSKIYFDESSVFSTLRIYAYTAKRIHPTDVIFDRRWFIPDQNITTQLSIALAAVTLP